MIIAAAGKRHFEVYLEGTDEEFLLANLHLRGGSEASENGGSILIDSADRVSMVGTLFEDNQAISGGALYLKALGSGQNYSMPNNVYLFNKAANNGGAIFSVASNNSVIEITNSTFAFNEAETGGAISTNSSNF